MGARAPGLTKEGFRECPHCASEELVTADCGGGQPTVMFLSGCLCSIFTAEPVWPMGPALLNVMVQVSLGI